MGIYCRHCRYDLRGTASGECPECGSQFDPSDPATFLGDLGGNWPWSRALLVGTIPTLLVAGVSWLTVADFAGGGPTVLSPDNFLICVPVFLLDSKLPAVFIVPLAFWVWCFPVLRGSPVVPTRSIVLLVIAVGLSALYLATGWQYGLQYQGLRYVIAVAIINLACWTVLGVLAIAGRRRPSWTSSFVYHVLFFTWLAWYAFPYLGETP